jgi:hypothetical protein
VEIVKKYEEEMVKRGNEEVETSVRAMNMVHDWETLMQSPIMKIEGKRIRRFGRMFERKEN